MLAYGLKSGAVPALRMFLVSAASFTLAYTLKDPFYPFLRGFLRKVDPDWVEAISFLTIEIGVFGVLVGTMLRYSREMVPMQKQIDRIAGAVFGVATGMTLAGMLLVSIMCMPGGRAFVGKGYDWYFAPHQYVLRAYEYLSRHMPAERKFSAALTVRDLEYGRPEMPVGESGLWVCSVPLGMRVYLAQARSAKEALEWKRELSTVLTKNRQPINLKDREGRRRKRAEGYLGRTPVLCPVEVSQVMVAVEFPLPKDLVSETGNPFLWDGEIAWWVQDAFREKVLVKIYRLERTSGMKLLTHIATCVPKGEEGVDRYEKLLPVRKSYTKFFKVQEAEAKFGSAEAGERYIDWLKRGGKAVFESAEGEVISLEITGDQKIREQRKPAAFEAQNLK